MMTSVRLRNVSKNFWVSHEKPALVREWLPRLVQPLRMEHFLALRDIDLEVSTGCALGIVGPNGSGKTTLLSLIAGITPPTTGTVSVQGRIAPLLTLGSGFHPELTGLENIFLNGSLLGMTTREIRKQLDPIVAFSQLDGFLDAPLQTYSAGMRLRLGFAIAVHTQCDILVIDEIMSVGDVAFQAKCLEKLLAFKRAGMTLIVAAQTADALQPLVDRALLLHQGRIMADGALDHVQQRYAALLPWLADAQKPLSTKARAILHEQMERHNPARIQQGWGQWRGTGEAVIEEVRFLDREGRVMEGVNPVREGLADRVRETVLISQKRLASPVRLAHTLSNGVNSGDPLTVAVWFTAIRPLVDPHIGVAVFRDDGTYCYGPNTRMDGWQFQTLECGTYEYRLYFEALHLTPGHYRLSVAVWDPLEQAPYAIHAGRYPLEVHGATVFGLIILDHVWRYHVPADTDAGADTPQLLVEGPHGRRAWYRTFEPLTLTVTLPAPHEPETLTLRAECRGSRDELWWVSRWFPHKFREAKLINNTMPHNEDTVARNHGYPRGDMSVDTGGLQRYQLSFPHLPLLTGRYRWSIGWEIADGARQDGVSTTCTVEVMADRLDHGIVHLPHRWEILSCQATSQTVLASSL